MLKIDGRTLDHGTSEHLRILAVRRVREDKEAPSEVMKSWGCAGQRSIAGCGPMTKETLRRSKPAKPPDRVTSSLTNRKPRSAPGLRARTRAIVVGLIQKSWALR